MELAKPSAWKPILLHFGGYNGNGKGKVLLFLARDFITKLELEGFNINYNI